MDFQVRFDVAVSAHFAQFSDEHIEELQRSLRENDLVVFEQLLPEELRIKLHEEAFSMLNDHGVRRELHIKQTGNTPRYFSSTGRQAIAEHGKYIPAFFNSAEIKRFLTRINDGASLLPVPYEPEEYIINRQESIGDTHGWHWDDYTFALIWIVEAPKIGEGALVEYVPKTEWDREDMEYCVQKVLNTHEVRQMYIPEGHCYLMRASSTLHRISPLTGPSKRTVIVFTYATEEDLRKDISHETMEQIWAQEIRETEQV